MNSIDKLEKIMKIRRGKISNVHSLKKLGIFTNSIRMYFTDKKCWTESNLK